MNIKNFLNPPKKTARTILGVLIGGSFLTSLVHYLSFRSLWLDEAFVATNIKFRSLPELFSALDSAQQFPRIYLSAIWILKAVLGYEVWVLRLLPFLFGLGAIVIWSKILYETFAPPKSRNYGPVYLAFLLFLSNHIYYNFAADFKQYTAEVFFSGWTVWYGRKVLLPALSASWGRWSLISLGWVFPIFLSFSTILVLLAFGLPLLLSSFQSKDKRKILQSLFLAGLVFACFSLVYAIDLKYTEPVLYQYWKSFFIGGNTFSEWLFSAVLGPVRILGGWWFGKTQILFASLAFIGLATGVYSWFRKKSMSSLVHTAGFLLLGLFILAVLKKYPLTAARLGLFFFPFAVILIVTGVEFLLESKSKIIKMGGKLSILGILMVVFLKSGPGIFKHFFIVGHWENINPAIDLLDKEKSKVVVYGSGTLSQVKAYPHLPEGFSFVYQGDHSPRNVFEDPKGAPYRSSFYYLMAYPNSEPEDLQRELKDQIHLEVKQLDKHLFYFSVQNDR